MCRRASNRCVSSRATRDGGPDNSKDELALDAWFVVDALPEDVLCDEPDTLWRHVLRARVAISRS